jgi:hypothetical protein
LEPIGKGFAGGDFRGKTPGVQSKRPPAIQQIQKQLVAVMILARMTWSLIREKQVNY